MQMSTSHMAEGTGTLAMRYGQLSGNVLRSVPAGFPAIGRRSQTNQIARDDPVGRPARVKPAELRVGCWPLLLLATVVHTGATTATLVSPTLLSDLLFCGSLPHTYSTSPIPHSKSSSMHVATMMFDDTPFCMAHF